ncbi:MAG: hypothetical protein ACR2L2_03545 [Acidobacteriota bacterium]
MRKSLILCFIAVVFAAPAFAQKAETGEPVGRIYEIKWRESGEIVEMLDGIVDKGRMRVGRSFNTITVIGKEAEHAVVRELIQKYDVPAKTIEFQFHILKASRTGQGMRDGVPEKIGKIVQGITALTRYQSFELLDAPSIRVQEGKEAVLSGQVRHHYSIRLGRVRMARDSSPRQQILIDAFMISFAVRIGYDDNPVAKPIYRDVIVKTSLTIADGETIVVGASQIQPPGKDPADEAIITVVTATVVK